MSSRTGLAIALALATLAAAAAPAAPEKPAGKTETAAATPPADSPAPFLWEVHGPKARHYLLGSVHMLPQSAHPLPPTLDAAYAATRATVFESDLAALAAPELQARMLGAAKEDRKGGLKARIGAPLYDKLQRHAKSLGLPTPMCETFRAWFCALTLEMGAVQQAGHDAAFGVDQYFFTKALDDGRPIGWLETPQQQVEFFTGMSDALSKQFLAATLDEATDSSLKPTDLHRIWRAGDLATLEKMMKDLHRRYPDIYARLLADRNRAWMPQLTGWLNGPDPQFVVAGAAHFAGPDGLIPLLREQGFSVVPAGAVIAAAAAPSAADPRPTAMPWLTPVLAVKDPAAALVRYQALGFERVSEPKAGEPVELRYQDARLLLRGSPEDAKAAPLELQLYVADVDAAVARARGAGFEVVEEPADRAGQRAALLRDADGHQWQLAARHAAPKPAP